ncbi:MAG: cytochrome C oxidase subunit IV family protein [Acidimicrobiia bacterium]
MNETAAQLEGVEVDVVAPAGDGAHAHPGARRYVEVAAILAAITAVEVGLYYTSLSGLLLVSILVGLAVIKFGMVAAYFMHLKFDGQLLRRLFLTGIVLAVSVFTIALVTMDVLLH